MPRDKYTIIQTYNSFDEIDKTAKKLKKLVDEIDDKRLPSYMDANKVKQLANHAHQAWDKASDLVVLAHDQHVEQEKKKDKSKTKAQKEAIERGRLADAYYNK